MRTILRRKPSPSMVISLIALSVSMGGTSYAAVTLRANSVGTKQLKKNAVTSPKVANGSLLGADFKEGQLPRGENGAPGPVGPAGAPGAAGAPGSALAFAHINVDGSLDTGRSKGIGRVSRPASGLYCIYGVAGAPKNITATIDSLSPGSGFVLFASVSTDDTVGDACAGVESASVDMQDRNGAPTNDAFFVVLN